MKMARGTGPVTATVKDGPLGGVPLVILDVEDGSGTVLDKSIVAANTCAAGAGDLVLVTTGSAARVPQGVSGIPVDATVVAVIDHLDIHTAKGNT